MIICMRHGLDLSTTWIVYAFASAVFAGITAVFAKIGLKETDSYVVTAIRTVVVLIFAWGIVFTIGSQTEILDISLHSLVYLILSGLATGGSWICYFKALELGNVNKVVPIDKSSVILTMILAFIFLGEDLTSWKLAGMVGIGIGTYLMIQKKEVGDEIENRGWLLYAVLSAVFAALTAILGKVGISDVESNLGTAIRTIVVLIMAWSLVFIVKKQHDVRYIDKKSWAFIVISGITTGLSWLCYYKALQTGDASIVVPIDKLSIVTVMLAYIVLNEKLTLKSATGLIILTAGTLVLLL